jgi:hypothetical protein
MRGQPAEGQELLLEALRPSPAEINPVRARALIVAGSLAFAMKQQYPDAVKRRRIESHKPLDMRRSARMHVTRVADRSGLVAQAIARLQQFLLVVRGEHFALEDREMELDLVEPTGVHGRVHDDSHFSAGPGFGRRLCRCKKS